MLQMLLSLPSEISPFRVKKVFSLIRHSANKIITSPNKVISVSNNAYGVHESNVQM